jgi:hypothetical protein
MTATLIGSKRDRRPPDRVPVPAEIEAKMRLWRLGAAPFPVEYIEFHQRLAERAVDDLDAKFVVHTRSIVRDGWADGMRVVQVVIEHRATNRLFKARWNDGQQCWFVQSSNSGGWTPMWLGDF